MVGGVDNNTKQLIRQLVFLIFVYAVDTRAKAHPRRPLIRGHHYRIFLVWDSTLSTTTAVACDQRARRGAMMGC